MIGILSVQWTLVFGVSIVSISVIACKHNSSKKLTENMSEEHLTESSYLMEGTTFDVLMVGGIFNIAKNLSWIP